MSGKELNDDAGCTCKIDDSGRLMIRPSAPELKTVFGRHKQGIDVVIMDKAFPQGFNEGLTSSPCNQPHLN